MGYQVYRVNKDTGGYRYGGYGVPAICEHPDCSEEINRGMSYACGGEPFSEYGCDNYFCSKHLVYHCFNVGGGRECKEVCERCDKRKNPFSQKPETKEWIEHVLKDESWEEWRKEEPKMVEEYTNLLK